MTTKLIHIRLSFKLISTLLFNQKTKPVLKSRVLIQVQTSNIDSNNKHKRALTVKQLTFIQCERSKKDRTFFQLLQIYVFIQPIYRQPGYSMLLSAPLCLVGVNFSYHLSSLCEPEISVASFLSISVFCFVFLFSLKLTRFKNPLSLIYNIIRRNHKFHKLFLQNHEDDKGEGFS